MQEKQKAQAHVTIDVLRHWKSLPSLSEIHKWLLSEETLAAFFVGAANACNTKSNTEVTHQCHGQLCKAEL